MKALYTFSVNLPLIDLWFGALQKVLLFLQILAFLMIVDGIAGVITAIYQKQLNSSLGRKGVTRKLMSLLLVLALAVIIPVDNTFETLYKILISGLIGHEMLSIIEHAKTVGVPLPPQLAHYIRKKNDRHAKTEMVQHEGRTDGRRLPN